MKPHITAVHYHRQRKRMAKTRSSDRQSQPEKDGSSASRTETVRKEIRDETPRRRTKNIEVRDITPSKSELTAPYMNGVPYNKPIQPRRQGDFCSQDLDHEGTSATAQSLMSIPYLLMITDGRKGHCSDVEAREPETNTPIKLQETRADAEPDVVDQLRKELSAQIFELQSNNIDLTLQLNDVKSQLTSLKGNTNNKIDQIICMPGKIRSDMADIRSSMMFLSDSMTALISSTMDAICQKTMDKSEGQSARVENP
ncbi:Cytochrome P450 CYP72A219 [Olea europaea subsp. europaea]|uniref:Cytochrome P450 CYP72A219 n=1 Tax=Olea europaea subsp. europaea TaxID=158383 RepID=A0A8S0UZ37_OLEEU|nr:Cytochrome P450 CYP72A219 [Olea europaea subsp. europaea]